MSTSENSGTRIVMLGSGSPIPDPDRSGPALAIITDEKAYLVDAGPGVVRRAAAASTKYSIEALRVNRLSQVFLTHLHHDHTAGLPDLMFTPWTVGRAEPLTVLGPPDTEGFTQKVMEAFHEDLDIRLNGLEPANETGWRTLAKNVMPGEIYRDDSITVEAFQVDHGGWEFAYGYKFITQDRSIVISGDTTYCPEVLRQAEGCDVLIHEAYSDIGWRAYPENWRKYHATFHTAASDLGKLAELAQPKLLVIHHILRTSEGLLEEVKEEFSGEATIANDLDIF